MRESYIGAPLAWTNWVYTGRLVGVVGTFHQQHAWSEIFTKISRLSSFTTWHRVEVHIQTTIMQMIKKAQATSLKK